MRSHYRLEVELTLLGPILTKGGQTAEPGIDAPLARDALGRAMLPYSLVKGKVLDAFHDLGRGNHPDVHRWLGKPSADGGEDPDRGRLRFSDFVTEQPGTNTTHEHGDAVIERVRIDRDTGSAARGALAMLEAPFGYGEEVEFTGCVEFVADAAEADQIRNALVEAFNEVPAFGALRTVGFGRVHRVAAELKPAPERSKGAPAVTGGALPVRLHLDRPLCVVGPKHRGNHFESLKHIPGAVLKGAAARLVQELTGHTGRAIDARVPGFRSLCRHFEAVRFAEARPMKLRDAMKRAVVPPLSLVSCKGREAGFWDAALWPGPRLIEVKKEGEVYQVAPAFDIDWKDETRDAVGVYFGTKYVIRTPAGETIESAEPPSERRTRTAISRDSGRAADEQLFSYGLAVNVGFVWETAIGLEGVPEPERAAVVADLRDLLGYGLPNIGKTRAVAHVEWLTAPTVPAVRDGAAPPDGVHVVTLQTDCLMTDPDVLTRSGLEAAYREFWADVSGGALELVRFFARQTLHGGHLARRTRQPSYEPFLVTDRGSTFVLKPTGTGDAGARLREWRAAGLPEPKWIARRYGRADVPLWAAVPFLPHVGFGEVAIDLACHTDRCEVNRP
ncbi:MAG: hypothetical protein J0I06_12510 [Planctomycetes bacterium]|nr:hypothetical protein [Planctomycetota bacterium]